MLITDYALALLENATYDPAPEGQIFDANEDRAVVTDLGDRLLISLRGTDNLEGWWSDFQIGKAMLHDHPELGPCEAGFVAGAEDLLDVILPHLPADKPISVQGHSRGAAMTPIVVAKLLLAKFRLLRCVAWEAPWAVGPRVLAMISEANVPGTTYWHGNDPVPKEPAESWLVPFVWPIRRIGTPRLNAFACHKMAGIVDTMRSFQP